MCIRDRHQTGDTLAARRDALQVLERAGHLEHTVDVLETHAVSYTHLRAHETVLDLVCRLLLEKKNTLSHLLKLTLQHTHTHSA